MQDSGTPPPYSPSSTQALPLAIIARVISAILVSSLLLVYTCIMVMAVKIILVSFNDQIPLNIEYQNEKYSRDHLGGGSRKLFVSMSIHMYFFPGKKIYKSQSGLLPPRASPNDLQGPENFSVLT